MSQKVAAQALELRTTNSALAAQLSLATASADKTAPLWEINVGSVSVVSLIRSVE